MGISRYATSVSSFFTNGTTFRFHYWDGTLQIGAHIQRTIYLGVRNTSDTYNCLMSNGYAGFSTQPKIWNLGQPWVKGDMYPQTLNYDFNPKMGIWIPLVEIDDYGMASGDIFVNDIMATNFVNRCLQYLSVVTDYSYLAFVIAGSIGQTTIAPIGISVDRSAYARVFFSGLSSGTSQGAFRVPVFPDHTDTAGRVVCEYGTCFGSPNSGYCLQEGCLGQDKYKCGRYQLVDIPVDYDFGALAPVAQRSTSLTSSIDVDAISTVPPSNCSVSWTGLAVACTCLAGGEYTVTCIKDG